MTKNDSDYNYLLMYSDAKLPEWIYEPHPLALVARQYLLGSPRDVGQDNIIIDSDGAIEIERADGVHVLVSSQSADSQKRLLEISRHKQMPVFTFSERPLFANLNHAQEFEYSVLEWDGVLRSKPSTGTQLGIQDSESVRALFLGDGKSQPFVSARFNFKKFIQNGAWGVFKEEELVGVIGKFDETQTDIEVGRLFVKPSYRTQGIGRELISKCLSELSNSQKRIFCWVSPDNLPSINAFERQGFKKIGNIVRIIVNAVNASESQVHS